MRRLVSAFLYIMLLPAAAPAQQVTEEARVLRFDADHRSRMVYWDEGLFPHDGWEGLFSRHRTRAGVTWTPTAELQFRAVLANEFFSWYRARVLPDFTLDEIFFDNLYVKWSPDRLPLAVTAGRQNLRFGDGFIVMDGGPLDGSRSIYFNALRVDVQPADGHDVTVFAMHQPVRDNLLPRINDAERALQEVPIDAAGVHYDCGEFPVDVQAYFLASRSEDDIPEPMGGGTVTDMRYTPGMRLAGSIAPGLNMTAEGAFQWGKWDASYPEGIPTFRDIRSWAWHASLRWMPLFAAKERLAVEAGYYQYSGGLTGGEETVSRHWDPLFGRWPIWSESFIYTLTGLASGIAKWSNVQAPFLRVSLQPSGGVALRGMLQHIRNAKPNGGLNLDPDIGTLGIAQVRLFPGEAVSGHLLLERMWYTGDGPVIRAAGYWWARAEVMYRWK